MSWATNMMQHLKSVLFPNCATEHWEDETDKMLTEHSRLADAVSETVAQRSKVHERLISAIAEANLRSTTYEDLEHLIRKRKAGDDPLRTHN